jgi:hypothetical protein
MVGGREHEDALVVGLCAAELVEQQDARRRAAGGLERVMQLRSLSVTEGSTDTRWGYPEICPLGLHSSPRAPKLAL